MFGSACDMRNSKVGDFTHCNAAETIYQSFWYESWVVCSENNRRNTWEDTEWSIAIYNHSLFKNLKQFESPNLQNIQDCIEKAAEHSPKA